MIPGKCSFHRGFRSRNERFLGSQAKSFLKNHRLKPPNICRITELNFWNRQLFDRLHTPSTDRRMLRIMPDVCFPMPATLALLPVAIHAAETELHAGRALRTIYRHHQVGNPEQFLEITLPFDDWRQQHFIARRRDFRLQRLADLFVLTQRFQPRQHRRTDFKQPLPLQRESWWNLSRCDRFCLRSRHLARTTTRIAANHQLLGQRASVLDCASPLALSHARNHACPISLCTLKTPWHVFSGQILLRAQISNCEKEQKSMAWGGSRCWARNNKNHRNQQSGKVEKFQRHNQRI